MKRLEHRVVVVTGGSRGLGRAIAEEAGREGARVWIGYRRRERDAAEAAAAATAAGAPIAEPVALDVRDATSVESAFRRVLEAEGRIDGLVTSAGIVADGFAASLGLEEWKDTIDTNLTGTMLSIRAVLRPMIKEKQGSIVALSSIAGLRASRGQASYAASKGGIVAFVRTVAAEVASHGVRANVVAPGLIDAGMVRATSRDRIAEPLSHVPLGRLGRATEVARAVTYLLSDDAGYVTGHTLVVDGGLSL